MKTLVGKNFRLATIAVAVGTGGLIGVFVPLPQRGKTPDERTVIPRSRMSEGKGAIVASLLVPDTITTEWVVSCANSRPDEFFRWLLKADPQPPGEVVEAFFSTWIDRNPDAAFRAALMLPARFGFNSENRFLFNKLLRDTLKRDPVVAVRWAGRLDGVATGGNSMRLDDAFFKDLGKMSPERFRAAIKDLPVGGLTVAMADIYAGFLARKDADAAVRWVGSLGVEHQNALLPMALYELEKQKPAAALEFIRSAPSHIKQYAALFALGRGGAPSVLEDMNWLAEEMGVSSYTGINNLMTSLYMADPKVAQDYVESLGERAQQVAAVRGLAEAACGRPENMVSMIAALPDGLQLEAANSAMLKRMPSWYPAFLKPLNDGSIREANMEDYIHQLAIFLDGETGMSFAMRNITWKVTDVPEHLAEFQEWIRDNPGPNRDRFIREAYKVVKDKPEVLHKAFEKVPAEELKRILGGGGGVGYHMEDE